MNMFKCKVCGHEWESRLLNHRSIQSYEPLCCPRCKRYDWKEEVEENV